MCIKTKLSEFVRTESHIELLTYMKSVITNPIVFVSQPLRNMNAEFTCSSQLEKLENRVLILFWYLVDNLWYLNKHLLVSDCIWYHYLEWVKTPLMQLNNDIGEKFVLRFLHYCLPHYSVNYVVNMEVLVELIKLWRLLVLSCFKAFESQLL